jgi:hypothetical protein
LQTCISSLPDNLPLKFSKACKDIEHKSAASGRGVDRFCQAFEVNISFLKICNRVNEVFEGPAEPIQPPDNKGVAGSQM